MAARTFFSAAWCNTPAAGARGDAAYTQSHLFRRA